MNEILYDNNPEDIPLADFERALDLPYDTDVCEFFGRKCPAPDGLFSSPLRQYITRKKKKTNR